MACEVAAVIVTFNPVVATLTEQLAALRIQVAHIVIIDNGSTLAIADAVCNLAKAYQCELRFLGCNAGIAVAQNRGIEIALQKDADYVLLLDHDSVPATQMVAELLRADNQLRSRKIHVAAVGPVTIDRRNGIASGFVRLQGRRVKRNTCSGSNDGLVEADFLIASGSLIHVSAVREFGLMNEGFFIDHVDTDWCFRARGGGGRIFGVCTATLYHALGDSSQRVWFGRWRHVFVHSPTRDYYIFRNTMLLVRHTAMPIWWKLHFLVRLFQFFFFFGAFVPPRFRRLTCMIRGLAHGVSGKAGPMRVRQ
jgi:rhamnosyltransferase